MTAVNSLGSQNGRHSRVRYFRSGEHKDLTECMFLSSHHELLIKKQTPPPLLFPVNSFILSTENPESSMAESGISTDSQVSDNAAVPCFSLAGDTRPQFAEFVVQQLNVSQ